MRASDIKGRAWCTPLMNMQPIRADDPARLNHRWSTHRCRPQGRGAGAHSVDPLMCQPARLSGLASMPLELALLTHFR